MNNNLNNSPRGMFWAWGDIWIGVTGAYVIIQSTSLDKVATFLLIMMLLRSASHYGTDRKGLKNFFSPY